MRALAAVFGVGAALAQGPSNAPPPPVPCVLSGNGATYDLTGLSAESGFYITNTRDTDDNGGASGIGQQWAYWFAVCNNMKPPPQTGCNTTSSSGVTPPVTTTGPAPAFQICVDPAQCGDLCFRLGDTAANAQLSSFPWNPAHGVRVSYTGGDLCQVPPNPPTARSLSLDFICYDQPGFVQSQDAVFEDVTCGYHALLYSRAGCPVQCPVVSAPGAFGAAKVCAGQGMCDYDSDKSAARCFCDNGWGGVDCTTAGGAGVPPVSWPALGGTVVGGIVLGIALLLGGVFARSYMAGGSFFDYLNFFGSGAACACGLGSLPLPWGAKASASAAGDYAPAPSEPSYKAPAPEPPSAFTSSVMHHEAPATGYAPPSGSLNDGPLL